MSILFLLYVFCFLLQESSCCNGSATPIEKKPKPIKEKKQKKEKPPKKEKETKDKKEKDKKDKKDKGKDDKAKDDPKAPPPAPAPPQPQGQGALSVSSKNLFFFSKVSRRNVCCVNFSQKATRFLCTHFHYYYYFYTQLLVKSGGGEIVSVNTGNLK